MPKFLEQKLKAEYPGEKAAPYKIMNSIGAMRGNKETAKGASMQAKHDADSAMKPKKKKSAVSMIGAALKGAY
jgi:hypothetical protein